MREGANERARRARERERKGEISSVSFEHTPATHIPLLFYNQRELLSSLCVPLRSPVDGRKRNPFFPSFSLLFFFLSTPFSLLRSSPFPHVRIYIYSCINIVPLLQSSALPNYSLARLALSPVSSDVPDAPFAPSRLLSARRSFRRRFLVGASLSASGLLPLPLSSSPVHVLYRNASRWQSFKRQDARSLEQ